MCEFNNYITVYFKSELDEDIQYPNGFEFGTFRECIEERKDKIDFILNGDDKTPINGTTSFTVKKGSKIDIFFKNITSLEYFFYSEFDENCADIISIDLSHLDSSSFTDLSYLFYGCENLKYINFLNFDTSKVTNMQSMFEGCESLELLDLSSFKTSQLTQMEAMFSGCKSLSSIYLSNFDTSSVTNMASLFSGCSILESIDLSYFNTSSVTEMASMFSDCENLKVLDISNFNMENVTKSDDMFFDVKNLNELVSKTKNGEYMLPANLSKETVSFANYMLRDDEKKRLNVDKLIKHKFITKNVKEFNKIDRNKLGDHLKGSNIIFNIKKTCIEYINQSVFEKEENENQEEKDTCGFAHNEIELKFHPFVYKKFKCNIPDCKKDSYCSFYHVDKDAGPIDMETEVDFDSDEINKLQKILSSLNLSKKEKDNNKDSKLSSLDKQKKDFIPTEFNPLTYKRYKCPLGSICKLDNKLCLNYHNEKDRRRNPDLYEASLCPKLYKNNKRKKIRKKRNSQKIKRL